MKRLLVFVFAVTLLGSCGKEGCMDPISTNYSPDATQDDGSCINQRTVKFVVELNTTPIVTEWYDCETLSNSNLYAGYTTGELSYSYISGDGVSQSQGEVESTWYSPNHSYYTQSTTYLESAPVTMIKGDNIGIEYQVVARCAINESYTFKAVVNDVNEYIIAENVSVNAVNPISENDCLNYIQETTNWIVP